MILLIDVGWIDHDPENPATEVLLIVVGWIDRDPENPAEVLLIVVGNSAAEVLLIVAVGWIDHDPTNSSRQLYSYSRGSRGEYYVCALYCHIYICFLHYIYFFPSPCWRFQLLQLLLDHSFGRYALYKPRAIVSFAFLNV